MNASTKLRIWKMWSFSVSQLMLARQASWPLRVAPTKTPGVDLTLADSQGMRAPFDGKVTLVGSQSGGSGNFVCILSSAAYAFDDGRQARVELTFMHLKEACVSEGMKVSVGDLIARGGRTGRTTGTHLHLAPKRVAGGLFGYRDLDRNDADNTFDPSPYWNRIYARRDA